MKQTIKEQQIGEVGTLVVTKELQKIIDYLHLEVGATEWSGILFYKLTKGDIDTLKDLEFTAKFLYPMDVGSHTYTEFNYDAEIVNAYDLYEEGLESSTGLIHSHNNFNTFFSGTDSSELRDNAMKYNYYISLIVNFAHEYCAKIAIPTKTKIVATSWFKNVFGKLVPFSRELEEDVLLVGDLKVVIEGEESNPQWLKDRVTDLKKPKPVTNMIRSVDDFSIDEWYSNRYSTKKDITTPNFSKNVSIKQPIKQESKVFNLNEQFLISIILLKETVNETIQEAILKLDTLTDDEVAVYADVVEETLDAIHEEIYGTDKNLKLHCIEVMALLERLHIKESYGYQTLLEILANYVTL